MEKLFSRRVVAEALGVSEQTVDRLRQSGALKTVKIGRRRVGIPASSLAMFRAYADCAAEEAEQDVGDTLEVKNDELSSKSLGGASPQARLSALAVRLLYRSVQGR